MVFVRRIPVPLLLFLLFPLPIRKRTHHRLIPRFVLERKLCWMLVLVSDPAIHGNRYQPEVEISTVRRIVLSARYSLLAQLITSCRYWMKAVRIPYWIHCMLRFFHRWLLMRGGILPCLSESLCSSAPLRMMKYLIPFPGCRRQVAVILLSLIP